MTLRLFNGDSVRGLRASSSCSAEEGERLSFFEEMARVAAVCEKNGEVFSGAADMENEGMGFCRENARLIIYAADNQKEVRRKEKQQEKQCHELESS